LLFFAIICTISVFAQEKDNEEYGQLQKFYIKPNLLRPGIAVEFRISKETTLHFETHMGFVFLDFRFDELSFDGDAGLGGYFSSSLGFRDYYNLFRRYHRGLNVNGFSADYVTGTLKIRYPSSHIYSWGGAGLAWGVQRRIGGWGNIDTNIGPQIIIFNLNNGIKLVTDVRLLFNLEIGFRF